MAAAQTPRPSSVPAARQILTAAGVTLAIALSILLAIWTMLLPDATQRSGGTVYDIVSAGHYVSETHEPPGLGVPWSRVDLPFEWTVSERTPVWSHWFRATFQFNGRAADSTALLIGRSWDGATVFLNGTLIGDVRGHTGDQWVRWRRPHLFFLPTGLVQPGDNALEIRMNSRNGRSGLSRMYVGDEKDLRGAFERLSFTEYHLHRFATLASGTVGIFMMLLWLRQREQYLFGLLGLAAFLWAVRTLWFVVEAAPLWLSYTVHLLNYAGNGAFVATMCAFSMRFTGLSWRRIQWLAVVYALIGPVVLLATGFEASVWVERWWYRGLVVLLLFVAAIHLNHAFRRRRFASWIALLAVLIPLVAGFNDYMVLLGVLEYDHPLLLSVGAPLMLIVLGSIMLDRFIRTLHFAEKLNRELETLNRELEDRVRQREAELAANYEKLRIAERQQLLNEERQRIMQDMHDGLGSQLLSSLVMVERGAMRQEEVAQVLRESIDDMRLAIDALTPDEAGFLPALGNLRYRMESRMRAAGIALGWKNDGLPETLDLPPQAALPVLRVIQEAMTNIFKHAGARRVDVRVRVDSGPQPLLSIEVADDGRGFAEDSIRPGRGLSNMRKRATKIGASLEIDSREQGTVLRLSYRLPVRAVPAAAATGALPASAPVAEPASGPSAPDAHAGITPPLVIQPVSGSAGH